MLNISKHYLATKWRSFASSLRGMLILRSTVHEVAGNLTIWPTVLDWCLFDRVIYTIAFRSLFSSNRLSKRTELYWNSSIYVKKV